MLELASVLTSLFPLPKFPPDSPLAPICLLLTSSVPSFAHHASCPSIRPYPFSPAYSFLSNSSPNTKWQGLRWTEVWIAPAKKVHQQGRQTLPRTSGKLGSRWKWRTGTNEEERGRMKVHVLWGGLSHCLRVSKDERSAVTPVTIQAKSQGSQWGRNFVFWRKRAQS